MPLVPSMHSCPLRFFLLFISSVDNDNLHSPSLNRRHASALAERQGCIEAVDFDHSRVARGRGGERGLGGEGEDGVLSACRLLSTARKRVNSGGAPGGPRELCGRADIDANEADLIANPEGAVADTAAARTRRHAKDLNMELI